MTAAHLPEIMLCRKVHRPEYGGCREVYEPVLSLALDECYGIFRRSDATVTHSAEAARR